MKLLFISSTYDDMKKERELLSLTLFPKIREVLEKYGESICFSPLSFGIKESNKTNGYIKQKTLQALFHPLEEVKPYMILFIGEKYGWIKESELMLKASIFNEDINISKKDHEIDYLHFLSKKYNDRILIYMRDLDCDGCNQEVEEKYGYVSCEDKENMRKLKEKIKKQFPFSYRTYKAKYDKNKKEIVLVDNLALMVENDLKDLLVPVLFNASRMSWQKKGKIAPEYFLNEKSKNYYPDIEIKDNQFDPYKGFLYDKYPIVTFITGQRGAGKTSLLANKFVNSPTPKMAFVFQKDEYSLTLSSFVKQLIYKMESVYGIKHRKYSYLLKEDEKELQSVMNYLLSLIPLADLNNPIHVYLDRTTADFMSFLLNLQFSLLNTYGEQYYKHIPFRFYVVFENDFVYPSINPLFDVSHRIELVPLENTNHKIAILRSIFKDYKMPIYDELINIIINKKDSSSPLYLKMVVHRLSHDNYLSKQEYKGNEYLLHLINVIEELPDEIPSLAVYLIKEVAINFDETFVYRLITVVAYSFRRVDTSDIKDVFNYMDWEFDDDMFVKMSTLLSVIFSYSEFSDTVRVYLNDNNQTISSMLNKMIIEKGYLKYLGSLSSYYLANKDIIKHRRIALKLAFVRITLALKGKVITQKDVDLWMSYLMDVFFKVENDFKNDGYDQKSISISIAEAISFALLNGFDEAILIFIAFANNIIKSNIKYEKLFKSYFYFIRTDFSNEKDVNKIVKFFDKVFYSIEKTNMFGDYKNDFSLWLKIKFTITKVRYYSISSPYSAKKELDDMLSYFEKENIVLPSFYKMQIYSCYLIIIARSKDKNMYEEVFENDIFTYFPFDDPNNIYYLNQDGYLELYKAKIYSLISLALASCYGDDKKYIFVPLVDRACEIFETHQSDYELTHFNSAMYTALIEVEALATPMYNKDPYVLNSFRYDARYFYPSSYFILEAEASYYYWLIMMGEDETKKKTYYLKYLSRRRALATSSDLLEAFKLYINVYAEFLEYIIDDKEEDISFHLSSFANALKQYFLRAKNDDDFFDVVIVLGQFFESTRINNNRAIMLDLYDFLLEKYADKEMIINCLSYLKKYYFDEEDCFELVQDILKMIEEDKNKEKFKKMKSLISYFDI